MITLTKDENTLNVHFEGTVPEVTCEIWTILEGYRTNLGDKRTLEFIECYLNHLNDELLKGELHD